jgi:ribosomal protein S8
MSLFSLSTLISQLNLGVQHKKEAVIVNNFLSINKILKLFLTENLIKNFLITEKYCIIFLKYTRDNLSLIKQIYLISKPGKRIYVSKYNLNSLMFKNKTSIFFVSTNLGILTSEKSVKSNKGGELLFEIKL